MPDQITANLLQYGIAGIAMLVEGLVIRQLYADNKALQKDKADGQEARRLDAVQVNEKIVPIMNEFTQVASQVYSKLKSSKDE